MQQKIKNYIFLLVIILVSLSYLLFLSEDIPFVWEDVEQINLSIPVGYKKIFWAYINPLPDFYWEESLRDPSLADRPLQVFLGKVFNEIFAYNPYPYHLLKNLIFCTLVTLLFLFLLEYFNSLYLSAIAGLLVLTSVPIFQSLLWCLEMEIISQFFMFIIYLLFFKLYYSKIEGIKGRKLVFFQILLFLLFITAIKSKPSSSVIPATLAVFILLSDYRKIKRFWVLLFTMLLIALSPKFLSPSFYYHQPFKPDQFTDFLKQINVVIGLPLVLLSAASIIAIIYFIISTKKSSQRQLGSENELTEKKLDILKFFASWSFFSMCLWPFLPSSETRYLAQSLIPLISVICISIYMAISLINIKTVKRWLIALFFILASLQIKENVDLSIQYRGGWGSYFIAINKAYRFIHENYSNALICYTVSWREIFYSYKGSNNDWIWVSSGNKNLSEQLKLKNISIQSNGFIKADSYEHIFWIVPPLGVKAGVKPLNIVLGKSDTLFDYIVEKLKIDIYGINLMTLGLFESINYPVEFYIVQIK